MKTYKRIDTEDLEAMGWQLLQHDSGGCTWEKIDLKGEFAGEYGSPVWKADLEWIATAEAEKSSPRPKLTAEVIGALGEGVSAKIGRMSAIYECFFAATGDPDSAACLTDTFYRAEM